MLYVPHDMTMWFHVSHRPRAFLTYHEALKCEYENWRIWENYMLVCEKQIVNLLWWIIVIMYDFVTF